MQKAKAVDKKKELQSQLTRVQQQIQEERSRRRKEAWEAEHKVSVAPAQLALLPQAFILCSINMDDIEERWCVVLVHFMLLGVQQCVVSS